MGSAFSRLTKLVTEHQIVIYFNHHNILLFSLFAFPILFIIHFNSIMIPHFFSKSFNHTIIKLFLIQNYLFFNKYFQQYLLQNYLKFFQIFLLLIINFLRSNQYF